jgi:uncharacterized membrane protein
MNHIQFYRGAISAGDCVSNGWNLVKQNYGMYLGIGLVALILAGCIPCVSLFLAGPIACGVFYVYLHDMRGEPVDFGMMFKGFENFLPAMIVGIIAAIPEIIGQGIRISINVADLGIRSGSGSDEMRTAISSGLIMYAAIVGLTIFLLAVALRISLFFAIPLITEHKLGALDAMKLSAQAAWANVGGLILLSILEFLIALGGALLCVVGIFLISIPLIYAANAFAYRQVFPDIQRNFRDTPPPPNVYGGSFGYGQ